MSPGVGESTPMAPNARSPCGLPAQNDSGKQQQAAEDVHEKIAVSRPQRLLPAAKPDQEDRGKGHQLPEQEQDEIIAGIDDPQGSGHIDPGGDVIRIPFDVQAVQG